MRALLLTLALILSSLPSPASAKAAHFYAVVFEATLGPDNRIDVLKVAKVIDPASGSTEAVTLAVPDSYVAAAREHLRQRTYPPQPGPFFTYLFYDPERPTDMEVGPR
jgi:hypothetical protein